jgi:RNA polymerase sigma-70 factor (ECF subfamily)
MQFLFCRSRDFNHRLQQSRNKLFRMAFAWSHNRALADDLVQETLAKALKNRAQLRDPNALQAWLFAILANCWRAHFRRQRDMDDIDEINLSHDVTPETLHGSRQVVHRIRAAVAQLPDNHRQVLTLVDLEEFSYSDVAQILEIPIGTVMSRLCRARNNLKQVLLQQQNTAQEKPQAMEIRRVK